MLQQIQALRGFAAVAVLLSHIHFIGKGAFGVDIFFCISGFIMMHISAQKQSNFLTNRAIRIVPPYWFFTFCIFTLLVLLPTKFNSAEARIDWLIYSLLFIPFDRNGYLEPLLGPGWTINYEVYFYLLFWLSLKASHKYRAEICTLLLLLGVFLPRLAACEATACVFYSRPVVLEFVLGMACYRLTTTTWATENLHVYRTRFQALGIASLLLLVLMPDSIAVSNRLIFWGVPSAAFFVSILIAYSGSTPSEALSRIGDFSYSLYLSHLFLVLGVDRLFVSFSEFNLKSGIAAIATVGSTLIAAWIFNLLLEQKFTNALKSIFKISRKSGV